MFLCFLFAEWRIQTPVHHQGPWQCPTEAWCDPQPPPVRCRSQRGPPSTGSTCPSHQGDGERGRSRSDGGVVMNSCCGRSSGGGCQANTSTWSPLAQRATQRKALLRGLRCRLPAGPPCHWHHFVAPDMRWWCLDLSSSFFPLHTGEPTFYMDHIQPLTSDPKPVFFPTQLQSCKHEGAEWVELCVCSLRALTQKSLCNHCEIR